MAARIHKGYFNKVRLAREKLQEQAEQILDEYMATIKLAQERGDHETAMKGLQWLIEHMPEEEGNRMVEMSIDKIKPVDNRPVGPSVQIGISVGGLKQVEGSVSKPKPLPAVIVEEIDNESS
jgi:hypothetical protein